MTVRTIALLRSARQNTARGVAVAAIPLLLVARPVCGSTYYVSDSGGDDARSAAQAQSIATPWKTIQKAASTMGSGDMCYVRAGTYREAVTPQNGQRFEAYASEKPLISGCDSVSGWTVHSGNIYKATVSSAVLDVFVGEAYMQKARYPNEDGDQMTAGDWSLTTCTNLSTSGRGTGLVTFNDGMNKPANHWVGGWYAGLHANNHYNANQGLITASTGNQITTTDLNEQWKGNWAEFSGPGRGYITDHLNCLDTAGEWHWQANTLYFWSPNGAVPANVTARKRIFGFDLSNRQNITIKGLYFKAASVLVENATGCVLDDCHFHHVSPWGKTYYTDYRDPYGYGGKTDGSSGIHISGTNNVIKNCSLQHAWGSGITLMGGSSLQVSNNYIADIGWQTRASSAPVLGYGEKMQVVGNTIRRTVGTGLILHQKATSSGGGAVNLVKECNVSYNDIRDTGYLMLDGGRSFIYIGNNDAPTADRSLKGGVVAYNVCSNIINWRGISKAFGIYLDDGTDFATVHHNVVNMNQPVQSWDGIFFHGAGHLLEEVRVYHNTLWGYGINAVNVETQVGRSNVFVGNNHAQFGRFVEGGVAGGTSFFNNRSNVPPSDFVDAANLNFRLASGASASVNAGAVIAGINDAGSASAYVGAAPDLGAYEFGGTDWTAGSTVTPPAFPPEDAAAPALAVPVAPSGLNATTVLGTNHLTIAWTDNATNEAGFNLERKEGAGGTYVRVATLAANQTSFLDTDLNAGATYYYRARAFNAAGSSAYSNESTGTVAVTAPIVKLYPIEDTWVRSDQPTANYGEDQSLVVQESGSRDMETYFRFSLNGLTGYTITGATLRLREGTGSANNGNSAMSVRIINGAWSEATTVWTNKPSLGGASQGSVPANSITEGALVVIALNTSLFTTNGIYNLALIGTSSGSDTSFFSSESAADRPELELTIVSTGGSPPAAPGGLAASAVSSSQINLSWTDNATNETGFKIERKTGSGGTYSQIAAPTANATSYNDTGLDTATTYFYRVRASNGSGDSAYSGEASATTFTNLPAAPSSLGAVVISSSQISLSWTDNATNEAGFKLERKTGAGGTYAPIATNGPNVTTFNNTGLAASTEYYYRVLAYNTGGDSAYSSEANATTSASSGGGTTTNTFNPIADTWVRADQPTVNNGANTTFLVQSGTRQFETYLNFNLTNLTGKTVTAAKLRLTESTAGTAGGNSAISVRDITGSWTEMGVTWNNKPAYGTTVLGAYPAGSITENQTIEITLSNSVFTADGNYDFALIGTTSGNDVNFASREASANKPELILELQDNGTPPAAPSSLLANTVSSSQINLSWTDNSTNETGFKIERKTGSGGTFAPIATNAANVTGYSDTGLSANTQYYYRVRASNAGGDSAYSSEANATTLPTPPLLGIVLQANGILLSWQGAGFVLQERTNLSVSGWQDFATLVSTNGTNFSALVTNLAGQMFFQLKQ